MNSCYWCGDLATRGDVVIIDGTTIGIDICNMCYLVEIADLKKFRKKRLERIGFTEAELMAKVEKPTYTDNDLIKALEEYIKLLAEELDVLTTMASIHGWKSTRAKQGEKLKHTIKLIKEGYTLF
jgi:hypothetical protein